ncbi:hypothetical protein IMSAGC007_02962 [Lachnospiraceae bacterium]|nr:hypothetical protein IMSAGC007_02962 [Lachnospiraceae bacterium]
MSQGSGKGITASVRAGLGSCAGTGRQDQGISHIAPSGSFRQKTFLFQANLLYPCIQRKLDPLTFCLHAQNLHNGGSLITVGIKIPVPVSYHNSKAVKEFQCLGEPEGIQRCLYKFRGAAAVTGQCLIPVGQIAAPVACGQKLLSGLLILLQHRHLCSGPGCADSGHQARGSASYNKYLSHMSSSPCSNYSFTSPASYSFCMDMRIPNFACCQVSPPWKYTA